MLNHTTKIKLDDAAAMLVRLAEELMQAGERDGALAASDAADAALVLLDLDGLKRRAQV